MTDTTTTTRRLVNCSTAFIVTNRHGSTALMLGHGADGEPERAMAIATSRPAEWTEGDLHYRVCGVAIIDVRTGEQWLWPLEHGTLDHVRPDGTLIDVRTSTRPLEAPASAERHAEPLTSLVQAYGDDYAAAYRFAFDVLPAGRDDHERQVRGELAHRRALGAIGKTTATTLIRDAAAYADELASGGAGAAKAAARYSDLVRANLPHLTDDERANLAAGFDGTVLVTLEPALKVSSPAADNVDGLTEVGC